METTQLKEIYKIMTDNGYDEIELRLGESGKIRMVRDISSKSGNKKAVASQKDMAPKEVLPETNPTANKASISLNTEICSELVGVFQFMDNDESYWPKVGDSVAMGETLGKISTINNSVKQIKSPIDGRISEIKVDNGTIVDYGCLLFVIESADESKA